MTDHPTPTEIDELVRGTLSGGSRRRLVRHLLRGCPRCSRLLAPVLAAPDPEAPPAPRAIACESSTDSLDPPPGAAAAAAAAAAAPSDTSYDQPIARACLVAVRGFQEIRRREAGSRLRGLVRVEALFAAAWDLRYDDPREMVRIAELALFAAERLDKQLHGRAAIADVRARAWAELANAYRVADDLAKAEQAMARAVGWLHRGSGDPRLLARAGDLMASMLADQRRFAEADELLSKVHRFYLRMGQFHLAGRAMISRGIFAGYDGQPRRALGLLVHGVELIDLDQDPALAVSAVHAMLTKLVDCGRHRQARIHLWRSRSLFARHGGRLSLIRLRWLEGRIHAGMGDLERAERELSATRLGFADASSPYNAALVALDLAAVWLQQGRTAEVRRLVEEMIATFRALRIAREAVAALLILREACDRDEVTLDRMRMVALLLTELERQPQRRPASEPADGAGLLR